MRRFGPVLAMVVATTVAYSGAVRAAAAATSPQAQASAQVIYENGIIYTADAHARRAEALAVREGRIAAVGRRAEVERLRGPATQVVDLGGRLLMPGLIDGHMHPLEGGAALLKCNLDYQSFTVPQFQAQLQACLDARRKDAPGTWLEAVEWFRYAMRPKGVAVSKATLDALHTDRPIVVRDSFGHSALLNSRALALAHIDAHTPDPVGGRIDRGANGEPTGMLEDAAMEPIEKLLPRPTAADGVAAARAAQQALAAQGVTSFLDAAAEAADLDAFGALARAGELTVRAHFAPVIRPADAPDPAAGERAVAAVVKLAQHHDQGPLRPAPSITVRNVKLFLDGVITAPANTGALLEPYRVNRGTAAAPRWEAGPPGPAVYFPAPVLAHVLTALARAGLDPHMHTDGDAAVRAALDGVQAMRAALPKADIRPALAHCELVDPADYPRFAALAAQPVLSLQWGKPAADTVEGARDTLGPMRWPLVEPAGALERAGARIAFGSDWPVDRLDEWFALKVGVTRTAAPEAAHEYPGRLGSDPGLPLDSVLRAITINAAYELHQEAQTGSLEPGKFADFIVLDRNVLEGPAENLATVHVLRTVVGGKVVHDKL